MSQHLRRKLAQVTTFGSFDRVPPQHAPERMDHPACEPAALACALDALTFANRRLGGYGSLRTPLRRALDGGRPGRVRILDVGTGAADIPLRLRSDLVRNGWRPHFVLADLHPATLELARYRIRESNPDPAFGALALVRLTGSTLPFEDAAFDIGFSSAMLHHLEWEEAVSFLAELDRVTRGRWIVTDLRRSRVTYLGVRCLSATLWRENLLAREDGPVSVQRAFVPAEAAELLRQAGVAGVARSAGLFRLRLEGSAMQSPGGRTSSR